MPWDLVILAVSLFVFIISMMATLGTFFKKQWKWFSLLLLGVVLSGACAVIELRQLLTPPPVPEMPPVIRTPLAPL